MKILVDEMPNISYECPFCGFDGHYGCYTCKLSSDDRCNYFDFGCDRDMCPYLTTIEKPVYITVDQTITADAQKLEQMRPKRPIPGRQL